jgi:MFS family permease
VVGGAITQGLAWQWIFLINVPAGVALIPLTVRRMPESYGPAGAVDLAGIALVTAAALGLVWGLVRGNGAGWGSPEVAGSLTAGTVLVLAFVAWERRAPAPMLPMRLFRSPAFAIGNAISQPMLGAANFSTVFGVAILVAVFAATGSYASPGSFTRGFSWAIAVSAVIALMGAAAGLALPASRRAGRSLSLAALRRSGTRRPACGRQL